MSRVGTMTLKSSLTSLRVLSLQSSLVNASIPAELYVQFLNADKKFFLKIFGAQLLKISGVSLQLPFTAQFRARMPPIDVPPRTSIFQHRSNGSLLTRYAITYPKHPPPAFKTTLSLFLDVFGKSLALVQILNTHQSSCETSFIAASLNMLQSQLQQPPNSTVSRSSVIQTAS